MSPDFPLLQNNPDLIYLDSAATALKPLCVLEAEQFYATRFGTNATRGLYPLAEKTSEEVAEARNVVARFIKATPDEIIFTSGTTAGINMLARSVEDTIAENEGEVVVSVDAHHSQVLPWQQLAKRKSWTLKMVPVEKSGHMNAEALIKTVSPRTQVIALTLVSNVYGVINDIESLVKSIRVKNPNAFIILDAAQAGAHIPLNVKNLGIDALVFSGHKLYGPTGVGVCYIHHLWQTKLTPGQFGGGMVLDTTTTPLTWKSGSEKFEAGTLPLAQVFGLKEALSYVETLGFAHIQKHEQELLAYAFQELTIAFGKHINFLGTKDVTQKIGLLSFTLNGAHPHDIASLLGEKNICVRAGEHCASFLHRAVSLPATTRISFGLYTTKSDIDTFVAALKETYTLLAK